MPKTNDAAWVRKPFVCHPDREQRKASVRNAVRQVLAMEGVLDYHKRELLSILMWKATEVDGKNNIRYRSAGVLADEVARIHHEHVVTRKELVNRLISEPDRYVEILDDAVGCLVTREEHKRLAAAERADPSLRGWDRYRAADIIVHDMKDHSIFIGE